MWTAFAKGALGLGVLVFLMQVLVWILDPILSVATAGPHADAASVVRVGGYFDALTLNNLVLIAGLTVAIALIGRAAVERRVRP